MYRSAVTMFVASTASAGPRRPISLPRRRRRVPRGDEHVNRRIARLRDVPACEGKPCPFEEGEPGRRAIARAREHDHTLRRHEHGKHAAHERTDKDRTERGEFEQSKNDDKDQGNEQDRYDMEGSG